MLCFRCKVPGRKNSVLCFLLLVIIALAVYSNFDGIMTTLVLKEERPSQNLFAQHFERDNGSVPEVALTLANRSFQQRESPMPTGKVAPRLSNTATVGASVLQGKTSRRLRSYDSAVRFLEECPDTNQCNMLEYLSKPHTLVPSVQIRPEEWVALIRVQKTASKTVTTLLSSLLRSFGRKNCLQGMPLAASFIPYAQEIYRHEMNLSTVEKKEFMQDPREIRQANWSEAQIISDSTFNSEVTKVPSQLRSRVQRFAPKQRQYTFPSYNQSAVAPWYKGWLVPGFSFKRDSIEGESKLGAGYASVAQSTPCRYWRRCHMHIRDVYGILVEVEDVKPEKVRLLSLLRSPVQRVLSEVKYDIWLKKTWDYTIAENFKKLCGQFSSFNTSQKEDFYRRFMKAPAHAYGMRNRQVKMLSGLVVEPESPLSKTLVEGFRAGDLPMVFCLKGVKCSNESRTTRVSERYTLWAESALREAKYQLLRSPAFIVKEKLADSLAVFLYTINWRPSITWDGQHFAGTTITQDKVLGAPSGRFSSDSKCSDISISCDYNTAIECEYIKNNSVSLPWCRLVRVASELISQSTTRHGADYAKRSLSSETRFEAQALNLLDQSLYEFSQKLLAIRIAAVNKALSP